MSKITTREMFIAVKEWGSISAAARALGTKRYNIANRKRSCKDEWEVLEKALEAGEIKVEIRNVNESYNAAKGNYGRSLTGKTHSIEAAKKTHVPKLKQYKPSEASKKSKKAEETLMIKTEDKVAVQPKKEWSETRDKDMFERGYQSAKSEYDKSLKNMAEEMEKLTEENQSLRGDSSISKTAVVYQKQIKKLESDMKKVKEDCRSMLETSENEKGDLEAEIAKKDKHISELEAMLQEANETKDAFNHEIDKIESQLIKAEADSSEEEIDFYKSTARLYFKQWREGVGS